MGLPFYILLTRCIGSVYIWLSQHYTNGIFTFEHSYMSVYNNYTSDIIVCQEKTIIYDIIGINHKKRKKI